MTLAGACSAAVINWGLLVLVLYALYYTALEPVAGASWGALLGIPMWLTATAFYQHVPHAWAWALGLHILSWFAQVGHAPQTALPSSAPLLLSLPVSAHGQTQYLGSLQSMPDEHNGLTVVFMSRLKLGTSSLSTASLPCLTASSRCGDDSFILIMRSCCAAWPLAPARCTA